MIEKIEFLFLGLHLLEPMAMVTNILVVFSCFFGVTKSRGPKVIFWRQFFLTFALASFTGGLSHLFWNYWGFYGKIAPWFFGVVATSFLTYSMMDLFSFNVKTKQILAKIIVSKAFLVLTLAYWHWSFLIVAIDTIASLILACGIGSAVLFFTGRNENAKHILFGVLLMLPAAVVFLLKIDIHLWMNREDLSHIFIAFGLLYFAKFAFSHGGSAARL